MYHTSFVGRQTELAELARLVAHDARLVTLLGPPGIGKTRLAERFVNDQHLAAQFVDLTEAHSGDDLERLVGELPAGDALVVLDNFEQLVDLGAPVVARWLGAFPAVRFIVTSREELRIAGEHVVRLEPLAVPSAAGRDAAMSSPAVQLFLQRSTGYTYDDADLDHIVGVVRQLEGIPLAIELAASRLRVLTPEQLSERLHTRSGSDVLGQAGRDSDSRHATLRRAIGWSWSLLDDDERSALAQCSVFRGTFPLDAAEAVVRVDGRALLDVMQSLTEKSLVRTLREPSEMRFGLFGAIRAFAREQLEVSAEEHPAILRHGVYYAELTRALGTRAGAGRGLSLVRKLSLDLDNLMGAFESLLSHPHTLAHAVERALSDTDAVLVQLAGRGKLGVFHAYRDAVAQVREAVAAHTSEVSPALRAAMFRFIGASYAMLSGVDKAHSYFDRALAEATRAGDDRSRARILYTIGSVHLAQREWEPARRALDEALAIARGVSDVVTAYCVLAQRGNAHLRRGRAAEAVAAFDGALELCRRAGDRAEEAQILCNLAIALQEQGAFADARERFDASLAMYGSLGGDFRAGAVLAYRGALSHEQGQLDDAITAYRAALAQVTTTAARRIEGLIACWMVSARAASGEVDAAAAAFEAAEARCTDLGDPDLDRCLEIHRGSLYLARFRAHQAAGERGAAREAYSRAVAAAVAGSEHTEDQRFARRIVAREIEAVTFAVARDGSWFRAPGCERVDLTGRGRLVRLLAALVDHHLQAPGEPMTVDALIERVWPGERMDLPSALNRIQVALTTARKLGLRELITRADTGYLLDAIALAVE